jgi:hypothetical protein
VGGLGSGRHKGAKKPRVESRLVSLKVSELQRRGALAEGVAGTLSWDKAGSSVAKINFRTSATDFTFTYESASAKSVEERVPLARVAAGFGGTRSYFQCPRPGCRRPVMALYFASGRFYCRRCHDLAYESQCENAEQLIVRHADKARARLGYPAWRPFDRTPIVRPRGMWRRKFWRLWHSVDEADEIANASRVMRLRSLADRLDKQMSRTRRRRAIRATGTR